MKSITVFTPTYDRKHLLPRLYESLKNQTVKDFVWLVIDDGSTDGTENLVRSWQQENIIEIQYHYKENGGMHTAHNTAYALIITELNVCIDSDDYMPADAVEVILKCWGEVLEKENFSGIIGLDSTTERKIIGSRMPEGQTAGSHYDLYFKYKATGDKKFVLKTSEVKLHPPYPEYKNEKLVPLGILYIMMGDEKQFVFLDEVICIVEYQEAGSSHTIVNQYKQSPRGFAYSRKIQLRYPNNVKTQFKNYVHLISSSFFAKDFHLAFEGVNPLITLLIYPFGILFHLYLLLKIKFL